MSTPAAEVIVDIHVPADHPSFAGHFPSRPLLPGVVLLAEVVEAVAQHADLSRLIGAAPTIETAKFLAPVAPDSRLRITLRPATTGIHFEVACGSIAVAKGRLSCGPASP